MLNVTMINASSSNSSLNATTIISKGNGTAEDFELRYRRKIQKKTIFNILFFCN